jgi:hypothetical protein
MLNLTITDDQLTTLVAQLPKDKKKELIDQLKFEEWLDSSEALNLKNKSERDFSEGKTTTLKEAYEKLKQHGKIS